MGLSPEAIIALVGVVLAVPSALFCCLGRLRHRKTEELDEAEERCKSILTCVAIIFRREPGDEADIFALIAQAASGATISRPGSQICLLLHINRERYHFSEEFLHIHLGAEISSNSQIVPVQEEYPPPRLMDQDTQRH
ncbi:hypothetical protein V8F06_001382 [Rhypophila decipiens]